MAILISKLYNTYMTTPHHHAPAHAPPHKSSGLAIASMLLGIISIIGFMGLILGIPAIILGIIALKKGEGEKGMSITGIVTGAISTIISLVLLAIFFIVFVFIAADASAPQYSSPDDQTEYYQTDDTAPRISEI